MNAALLSLALVAGSPESPSQHADDLRGSAHGNIEQKHLWIADQVRGYAGYYLGTDRTVVLLLVDPKSADEARAEVKRVFGHDTSEARVQRVKYDYAQLVRWKREVWDRCIRWLSGIGVVEQRNLVLMGLPERSDVDGARKCASEAGVPSDAFDSEVMGRLKLQ